MLACIWGGDRYAWDSADDRRRCSPATRRCSAGALVARERRAADPIVPLDLLRTPVVAVASAALFLATAALFAVTVFVPLFLQAATGATPDRGRAAARADDARHHACRRTSPGARSRAPGATSASRSPAWR